MLRNMSSSPNPCGQRSNVSGPRCRHFLQYTRGQSYPEDLHWLDIRYQKWVNGPWFCRYSIATISRALENESGPGQDTSVANKTIYGQHYHQLETVREEKMTGQSSQEMDSFWKYNIWQRVTRDRQLLKRRAEDYAKRWDTSGFFFINPFSL